MSTLAAFTPAVPPGFAMLPHAFVTDYNLGPFEIRLGAHLLQYARDKVECWPSDGLLAECLNVCVKTVQNGLRKLARAGYIDRVRDYRNRVNPTNRLILLKDALRNAFGKARGVKKSASTRQPVTASTRQPVTASTRQPVTDKASLEEEGKKNGGPSGPAAEGPPSGPPGETEEDRAASLAELRAVIHRPPPGPPPKDPAPVSPLASLPAAAAPKALEAAESRRRELAAQLERLGARPRQGPPETPPGTAMEGYVPPFHPKE